MGAAYLVYLLVLRWLVGAPHRALIAVAAASLFAIHPSHVETVAWIAARTDLCATFFALLALILFHDGKAAGAGLALLVGLMCKESVVVVPLIAAAQGFAFRGTAHGPRRTLEGFVALGLAFCAYTGARLVLMGSGASSGMERILGVKALGTSVVQVVRTYVPGLPFGDPTLNNTVTVRSAAGIATLALGGAVLLGLAVLGRRRPETAPARRFLLIGFAVSLLPAVGLSVRLFRSQGERFLYLPSVFLLTWLLVVLVGGRRPRLLPAVLGVTAFAALQVQVFFWRQGAAVAKRVEASIAADVVPAMPAGARRITFINPPSRVQGSYVALHVLGEIARDHGLPPGVETGFVIPIQAGREGHRVELSQAGDIVTLTIDPRDGAFIPEDMFGSHIPTDADLRSIGVLSVTPERLEVDLRLLPPDALAVYWDGKRFHALARPG